MLIFDANNTAIIIDSIHTPIVSDAFWVLDLDMMDFTLTPLTVLQEVVCPTIEVCIHGFKFNLPANWNILVVDPETMQLDVAEIAEVAGKEFKTLLYGPKMIRYDSVNIQVTDYFPLQHNVGPFVNKHHMLCHPVSPNAWVCITPYDVFNRYLTGVVAGDLI